MAGDSYHHGAVRASAITAGLRRARDGGPDAVTLRDVARDVGVSASALYRHFPDLDHLRAEVAAAARAELARRLLAARDAVPRRRTRLDRARAELVATGTAYIRFAVDEPRLFATAFAPTGTAVSPDEDPNAWGVLTDVVDALDAAGGIDSRRRADAAFVAWSAVHGTATILVGALQPTGRSDVSIDRAVDAVTAAVVRALAT